MATLVTGGAGFLGSHLCERLLEKDEEVICLDNFFTGRRRNVAHLLDHPNFELIRHDVVDPLKRKLIEFTIWHVRRLRFIISIIRSRQLRPQ